MTIDTSASEPAIPIFPNVAAPPTPGERSTPSIGEGTTADRSWQLLLLPLMRRMIVGLSVFFFAASMVQLYYLNTRIEVVPQTDLARLGLAPDTTREGQPTPELRVLASLDAALLERRYHQANVFLMGRLWTSYLGFVTGMILALVGAVFILGRLRDDPIEAAAKGSLGEGSLRTSSPGIILAALGVALMITTIVSSHPIQTADSPVYVGAFSQKPSAYDTTPYGTSARDSSPPRP